ncbi:unnamed protein product [Effrenium voratum]|nr:unnamed protein product [Effrenium voratum]
MASCVRTKSELAAGSELGHWAGVVKKLAQQREEAEELNLQKRRGKVFLEISSNMVQLELVCRHLREELPKQIEAAGAGLLTLVALDGGGVEPLGFAESRVYVLRKKGVGYGSHLV